MKKLLTFLILTVTVIVTTSVALACHPKVVVSDFDCIDNELYIHIVLQKDGATTWSSYAETNFGDIPNTDGNSSVEHYRLRIPVECGTYTLEYARVMANGDWYSAHNTPMTATCPCDEPTPTPPPTSTYTPTSTSTSTTTPTNTSTLEPTPTDTSTPTNTPENSPTPSNTPEDTPTITLTPPVPPTETPKLPTPTATATYVWVPSPTPTETETPEPCECVGVCPCYVEYMVLDDDVLADLVEEVNEAMVEENWIPLGGIDCEFTLTEELFCTQAMVRCGNE